VTGPLLEAALALAGAGCSVVPARPDGSKAPATEWRWYQKQRPATGQVEAWLGNGTYDGFGVICGAVSGGLEMLEFEGRAVAAELYARYIGLLADHGLGELWQQITTATPKSPPAAACTSCTASPARLAGTRNWPATPPGMS
jgi:putative DNA primase/helicase